MKRESQFLFAVRAALISAAVTGKIGMREETVSQDREVGP